MFAKILSFLGIEKETALIFEDKIPPLLDLYVHFEQFHPGPFNWFSVYAW